MKPKRVLQAYALNEPVKVKLRDGEVSGTIISVGFQRQTRFPPGTTKRMRHRIACTVLDSNENTVYNCLAEDVIETQAAPTEPYGEDIVNYLLKCFQL